MLCPKSGGEDEMSEGSRTKKSKAKEIKRAAVVIAGVAVAAVATSGTDAARAASTPKPGVTTTGTIFACYSNTTKELFFTTKTKGCKTGQTELSWNAAGPQGPQ